MAKRNIYYISKKNMCFHRMASKYLLICLFLFPTVMLGQSLLLEKKQFEVSANSYYSSYKSVFDMDGERKPSPKVMHAGMRLNMAFGFHSRWNAMLSFPYFFSSVKASDDPGGISKDKSLLKPGDSELGLRFSLPSKDGWHSCFTAWQSLGTAYRDKTLFLHSGYADFNTRLYFNVRYCRSALFSFETYAGFNKRNKNNSDEAQAGVSASILLGKNFYFDGRGDLIYSLENNSKNPIFYELGLFHNNARMLSVTGAIRYETKKKLNIWMGYTAPVRGQYATTGQILNVGINYKFSKAKSTELPSDSSTSQNTLPVLN